MAKKLLMNVDGGSRGNPGKAAIDIIIREGESIIEEYGEFIGLTTNNVAEYTSLIKALEISKNLGASEIEIYMDSELVIRQITGAYAVRASHLAPLFKKAKELESGFKTVNYKNVPREDKFQQKADAIVNKTLDSLKTR